jgi:2-dehydro-3-deoxygalactonokinase
MYCATIDCGTTNSRVYIVDGRGSLLARAGRKVGVRDTAINGNNAALRGGLREIFDTAVRDAGLRDRDIACILSSGMITSELGLVEIPHLWAPCALSDLAANLEQVKDLGVFPPSIPLYFVRGIKNRFAPGTATIADVGELDFMRGEEAQVAGLLTGGAVSPPALVVVLSSHTKFIPVDVSGRILGSVTTLSGQLYEAIVKETFVGKSVRSEDSFDDTGFFEPAIVDEAARWVDKSGFLRALMFPRFLDTLLHVPWYRRRLFAESLLAAEDMRALGAVRDIMSLEAAQIVLVGLPRRCAIYRHLLDTALGCGERTRMISDEAEIDSLSIRGVLSIAEQAGVVRRE